MRAILALLTIAVFAWADAYDDGAEAARRGDWQEAAQQFTQAIEQNPNNANAYLSRGISYGELGDWSKAIADFTQAIRINPKNAQAYSFRSYSYAMLNDLKKATLDARKACELGNCDLLQVMEKNGHILD